MLRIIIGRSVSLMVTFLFLLYLLLNSFISITLADPLPTDWMDTNYNPSLGASYTLDQATYTEDTVQPYDQCTDRTFTTRPARPGQSQQTITRCWYDTAMGLVSGNYGVAKGENIAGMITGRASTSTISYSFKQTSNPNVVLDIKSGGSTPYTKFQYGPTLTKTVNADGSFTYAFSSDDTFTIQNQSGSSSSSYGQVRYSEDGTYAVFANGITWIRVNLDTKMILTFSAPTSWYPGFNMWSLASITNNGEYAVITAIQGSGRWMRIFDLTDCTVSEYAYALGSTNTLRCAYRDFTSFIQSSIPSFSYFTDGEFVDNDTIAFYHRSSTTPYNYTYYLMSISDNSALDYMALGDSISSGEGTFSYVFPTDEDGTIKNKCHTSSASYPYLIDESLTLDSFSSFACSGATTPKIVGANGVRVDPSTDLYSDNQYYYYVSPSDNYQTTHYWSPGFEKQIRKVIDQKPNVLTITIGANDIGFAKKIESCIKGSGSCFDTYEERKELATEINRLFNKTYRMYDRLKNSAASKARLYALGYPNLVNPSGSCGLNVRLTAEELQLVEDVTKRLNLVIEAAAARAGVFYVDTENALAGKRLCEGVGANIAVNGLTAGNDHWVIGNESYHPNTLGHQEIRDAVLLATNDLTVEMPEPDSSITAPVIDDSIPLLANATKTNRLIRESTYKEDLTAENIIYRSDTIEASVNGFDANTKSGASYQAEIHSTPIPLGTFTSDDNGDINISAAVPNTLDPGFHTLHVYGKDIDNKDIDLYKTIFIAETEEDWDGDLIENDEDPCVIIQPSGIDADEDMVDDACDPVIGETPDEEAFLNLPSKKLHASVSRPEKYKKQDDYFDA